MYPLYQRLKELDSGNFEKLCFHLLNERHPNSGVMRVDGVGGDCGVDIFAGKLEGRPIIWQCKSFPNGIRDSQKNQIRESFNAATQNFDVSRWILCLSIDMDISSMRWFKRFVESKAKANAIEVGLWQASHIVHELFYRRTICNAFFPDAVIDTMQLRQLLLKTESLEDHELEAVATENVEQLIERFRERDARFNYQVTYGPDVGGSSISSVWSGPYS